ncbi:pyruvate formate lyase activating enzyme [Gaeumannomyces tritici R3-111a-1]|uniref:Pyruvate formate lyase activating enzyme n=1 Tax=Gaeumannomyces tritici (strain R3-111a-1) TaxID=644352 RepID=J3NS71_GAET3|nr:pyruvate formate lyase activating enzyme [Gaeumannomyces tritici R3-111a-1]EJT79027.1 pyruvate formate lyase activating enzyme [Gaeumannomyces tritici R3-111a-1]
MTRPIVGIASLAALPARARLPPSPWRSGLWSAAKCGPNSRRPTRAATAGRTSRPGDGGGRRSLHLAPPFLLDEPYVPRYARLSAPEAARKGAQAAAHLRECNLCPRRCGVDRRATPGMCGVGELAKVNVVAPHFGEEPCLQGTNGSGSIFFSMCNLRCAFCQNHDIAHSPRGHDLTPGELAAWFVKLQDVGGVHNVNLVTPEHVVPQVALAVLAAAGMGLRVPVVYNTSAYDSAASLELLDGLVDVYLPDFKLWSPEQSRRLLKAADYPETARASIREMHRQVGDLCFTPDGIAQSGLLVRHLVMPGLEAESARIMSWIADEISRDTFVHIMDQYRPAANVGKAKRSRPATAAPSAETGGQTALAPSATEGPGDGKPEPGEVRYADINRAITEAELSSVRKAAEDAGLWRFCDPPRHGGFHL